MYCFSLFFEGKLNFFFKIEIKLEARSIKPNYALNIKNLATSQNGILKSLPREK